MYTVIVTSENGCSEEITIEITEPEPIELSETHSDYSGFGVSEAGATDGYIDITVSGGTPPYTYSWSNGDTNEDLNDIDAGTYTLTVTDDNGCEQDITVEITEPDNSDEILSCSDPEACNYDSNATNDDGSCTYPTQTYLEL